jgi:hypothetical protein
MPRKTYTPEFKAQRVAPSARRSRSRTSTNPRRPPSVTGWPKRPCRRSSTRMPASADSSASSTSRKRSRRSPKSNGLVRRGEHVDPEEGFAFMAAHQAEHSIWLMARVLGLSRSGYYARLKRQSSPHTQRDEDIGRAVREAHVASRGIYGAPRIHVSRKRVARLTAMITRVDFDSRSCGSTHSQSKGSAHQLRRRWLHSELGACAPRHLAGGASSIPRTSRWGSPRACRVEASGYARRGPREPSGLTRTYGRRGCP